MSNSAWQISEYGFPLQSSSEDQLKFLLRYAILAPSSHNSEPWKFAVLPDEIRVYADDTRWLKVADADQRELYISLGCALENLLIAAAYFGYKAQVSYFPEAGNQKWVATVKLAAEKRAAPLDVRELFYAIPLRHTNRQTYQSKPIAQRDLAKLESCFTAPDIQLHLTDDAEIKRKVDELVSRADMIQFADPKFREELGHWIGEGSFGQPWLIARLGQLAVTYLNLGSQTAKQDSELLQSAPVLAVLSSKANDRLSQVKAGQVFERILLNATMMNLGVQPMSQILQVPQIKAEFAALIPTPDAFPQVTFRLGYAEPEQVQTPRQQVEDVLL